MVLCSCSIKNVEIKVQIFSIFSILGSGKLGDNVLPKSLVLLPTNKNDLHNQINS